MVWDAIRMYPPVRACAFFSGMTGVTFLGDPNTGSGLPRGTLLYSNQAIPQQVSVIYGLYSHYFSITTQDHLLFSC